MYIKRTELEYVNFWNDLKLINTSTIDKTDWYEFMLRVWIDNEGQTQSRVKLN